MATSQKKTGLYERIDETLAGGLLPGGAKLTGSEDPQAAADREAQQACVAKGGKWDIRTRKCIMPQPQETETPKPTDNKPIKRSEAELGAKKYAFLKGTAQGLNELEIQDLERKARVPEFEQIRLQQEAQQQQAQQQQIMNNLSPEVLASDGRQVVQPEGMVSKGATIAAAGGGAVVGAKAGAALGTLVAPGIGTVIGGIVGGIGGAIGGAYAKMKVQKLQDVKEATKTFSQAKTNKNEILNMVNAGLVTEGQARELWREEKMNIISSYAYLKSQTQNDLNNFLSSPGDELIQIESYLALDGLYDLEFEKALMLPNPSKIRIMPTEQ